MRARRAATEGGIASGEWIFLDLLSDRPESLFSLSRCDRFRSCVVSCCPRKGITTGEEGVVGLELSVEVVVDVVDDMSLVSRFARGLVFPSGSSYLISLDLEGEGEGEGEGARVNRKLRG